MDNSTDGTTARNLADLATAARELSVAMTETIIPGDQARELTTRLRELTKLISGAERDPAKQSPLDDLARGVRFFSPVSGQGNPAAPPVTYDWSGDDVTAEFTLGARFGGPPGYVHGGIIALLFDEILAQSAIRARRWGMTAYLHMTYLRATPLGVPLVGRSRITSVDGRKTLISGDLTSSSEPDVVLASAEALFVIPREETAARYFDESVTSFRGALGKPLQD